MEPLILGSGSETRAKILTAHNIPFIQIPSRFDEEQIKIADPKSFVFRATVGKMHDCLNHHGHGATVLCADTVVAADNTILRKAKDRADARRILEIQSGNRVEIITCTMYHKPSLQFLDLSVTTYDFAPFDPDHLEAYLESGEWQGKAGACMVEGFCKPYIKKVSGLESCAMGLTIEKLIPFL